ncbi:hypothetical protein FD02_GL001129 [Lacticaseibacillus nasuensis JCM 17158]|uniref:Uncharacterized protein n=1 Tax=Lacticaseibacillus nasuensis JCM 17158 TaxID=1291734 RepID=A0A0R1K1K9_9LACO|nr:hypothetical protein FD02_GL001129 [Lacticaseibacillus nasuensis JCM 17158]
MMLAARSLNQDYWRFPPEQYCWRSYLDDMVLTVRVCVSQLPAGDDPYTYKCH